MSSTVSPMRTMERISDRATLQSSVSTAGSGGAGTGGGGAVNRGAVTGGSCGGSVGLESAKGHWTRSGGSAGAPR